MPLAAVRQAQAISDLVALGLGTIQSQATVIESDFDDVAATASQVVITVSDTAAIEKAVSDILSDGVIIKSDLVVTTSDLAAIETKVVTIASDIVESLIGTVASQVLINRSACSDILSTCVHLKSDLILATSDLGAVEVFTERIGQPTAIRTVVAVSDLTNNTQVAAGLLATASGHVLVEQVYIAVDGTGAAGPANFELSTDCAWGPTGVDDPVAAEATASLGANVTVLATAASVTPLVPFVLENAKKLYIHGSNGAGSGAGNLAIVVSGRGLGSGAKLV